MRSRFSIAALALLGLSACQKKETHPPLASDQCGDAPCQVPIGGGGIVGGISGSNDAGTTPIFGGDSGVPDAGSAQLTGSVQVLSDPDFSVLSPLGLAQVEIDAPSARGGLTKVTYTGGADFVLQNIEPINPVWVGVLQLSGAQPLMTTLQLVDPTKPDPVALVVLDRATLDELTQQGSLSTPVDLQPTRGHAVLNFVDATGTPLDNVKVTSTTGTTVAYDAGATYSDVLEATSDRGSVLILNMDATGYPGSSQTVSVSHGTAVANVSVQIATNSISFATVKLQ